VAAAVVACFAAIFLLTRFPRPVIQPALLAAWPLHLFTICFLGEAWFFHDGARLGAIIAYTIVAYASFLLVPLCLLLDRRLFDAFVKIVAIGSALLAIPSFIGAMGVDSILGIPLSNKYSYSNFSGIIASGGIFEHAEGHALQMAVGLMCCYYALRKTGKLYYGVCLAMVFGGLVVSQGRGAIFGVAIAVAFCLLPELFRRSRPVFLGSLALCLVFPFLILPQLANVPGVSGYLRLERGLSGRDVAWEYAFSLIEEEPWTGHGFGTSGELSEQSRELLRKSGYAGAGTTFHNTFITKAVELGMVVAFIYTLLYIVPLIRICKPTTYINEQQLVRSIVVVTLTASIFRDYNIGGVRSTSMMVAIFWGLANFWPLAAEFEQASQDAADNQALPEETTDRQTVAC
jgi:O-antigen ligase